MLKRFDRWFIKSRLCRFLLGEAMVLDEGLDVAAFTTEKSPHESTSAICGNNMEQPKPCLFCKLVCGFIQNILGLIWPHLKTHCHDAWAAEKAMVENTPPLP